MTEKTNTRDYPTTTGRFLMYAALLDFEIPWQPILSAPFIMTDTPNIPPHDTPTIHPSSQILHSITTTQSLLRIFTILSTDISSC